MSSKQLTLFHCRNLRVTVPRTGKTIVRKISFTLEKGKNICIMGESGSGKTTIANHVAGFQKQGLQVENPIQFQQDDITVFSVCQDADFFLDPYKRLYYYVRKAFIRRMRKHPRSRQKIDFALLLDYVCHLGLLKPLFEDNGRYESEFIEKMVKNGTRQEKEQLGLVLQKALKTKTKQKLSGGEKQKFFLLLAFIVNPDILVADEIFTDIDDASQKRISQLIFKQDFTVIFISHNISLIKRLIEDNALSCVYYLHRETFDPDIWHNSPDCPIPPWATDMIHAYENLVGMVNDGERPTLESSAVKRGEIYHIQHAQKVFHDGRLITFNCRNGDIRLHKGVNYAFVGENGAGKTTLFKILAKLYDFKGDIHYSNGNSFKNLKRTNRLDFVYRNQLVFQKTGNAMDDNKPVMEYLLSYFKRTEKRQAQNRIECIVGYFFSAEKAGTILRSPFYDLSVGEQRRVLLIQALLLVDQGGVLFIDEAMRGMDIFLKEKLVEYLKQKKQQVFLITHDSVLVNALCHQYILFEFQRRSRTTFLSGPFDITQRN